MSNSLENKLYLMCGPDLFKLSDYLYLKDMTGENNEDLILADTIITDKHRIISFMPEAFVYLGRFNGLAFILRSKDYGVHGTIMSLADGTIELFDAEVVSEPNITNETILGLIGHRVVSIEDWDNRTIKMKLENKQRKKLWVYMCGKKIKYIGSEQLETLDKKIEKPQKLIYKTEPDSIIIIKPVNNVEVQFKVYKLTLVSFDVQECIYKYSLAMGMIGNKLVLKFVDGFGNITEHRFINRDNYIEVTVDTYKLRIYKNRQIKTAAVYVKM